MPKTLKAFTKDAAAVELNRLWRRRHCTKFNGVSYITQRATEAVYSPKGKKQIRTTIELYMANARLIRKSLTGFGYTVFGGVNAPYLWLKTPKGMSSWEFFDKLLNEAHVVGTPGTGFGPAGEGYFRLTAFGHPENVKEAIKRIEKIS